METPSSMEVPEHTFDVHTSSRVSALQENDELRWNLPGIAARERSGRETHSGMCSRKHKISLQIYSSLLYNVKIIAGTPYLHPTSTTPSGSIDLSNLACQTMHNICLLPSCAFAMVKSLATCQQGCTATSLWNKGRERTSKSFSPWSKCSSTKYFSKIVAIVCQSFSVLPSYPSAMPQ